MKTRALAVLLIAATLAWGAPLAGLALAGRPWSAYAHFPPRTIEAQHAAFSWLAFAISSLPVLAACALYASVLRRSGAPAPRMPSGPFPWWGAISVALIAAGWACAWIDGLVPFEWRRHAFTPLWLGYAILMNALAMRRGGSAPLLDRPAFFVALFPASGIFWWLFEHLDQFTRNWRYSGIEAADDWTYFVQATLPFCTVLPAVASTWAWLRTFPRLEDVRFRTIPMPARTAWIAIAVALASLGCLALWPEVLYPMLWVAPAMLLLGLQHVALGQNLLSPLARGDWRPLLQPALAALVCGFFWELWNWGSVAKWHYSVPYVDRFHVFEMPLLGYAGYLPFGVACAGVIDLLSAATSRKA